MEKLLSKSELYAMNTIASKKVDAQYRGFTGLDEFNNPEYKVKNIKRTKYLKICWNCSCAYESCKYNSYACSQGCSWNINYRLKRGIAPPVNMAFKTKAKNIKPILAEFGYI